MDGYLDIINEKDEVVGRELRSKIHKDGLLHREVHIWFVTPKGEIIFQHRAKDKETYPDKLDATVGGHVEIGATYEETALKEGKEETGVDINPQKLHFLAKQKKYMVDGATGLINNSMRAQFAYLYDELLEGLVVEKGKALGFEAWKIEALHTLSAEDKEKFIPVCLEEDILALYDEARKIFGV